ncbi:UEV-domain-containing protein [Dentipellis sp. KUC8613]|nr:UEV-domain-containing protein [Dentipellis sp. KUC8613]
MTDPLTLRWLRQNIESYTHRDAVFSDVHDVLARFPSLRPKTDVYTYDDGRTQLLLLIHGLLPITYRQASYHIPIAIWLTRDYPKEPPIAYVVPTADMLVKPGKYMDVSGRSSMEYLQNWARKSEGCSLSALLDALQLLFSQDPPVYSKPKQSRPTQSRPDPSTTPDYARRPPPPVPPADASATPPRVSTTPIAHNDRPALPPKPSNSLPLPILAPGPAGPYPAPTNGATTPLSSVPDSSSRWSLPLHPPPPPAPNAPAVVPSPAHDTYVSSPPSTSLPGPPGQPPYPIPAPVQAPAPVVVQPRPPVPDLLDEDASLERAPPAPAPAPPRPPNPELLQLHAQVHAKLSSELASLSQVMALDAERLRAHQTDLLAGEPAIRDEMARLEAVRDVCRGVATRLRGTVEHAERNVAELRRKGDPPVDELVCSTSIVHNQLVDLVADDNTIEDTIYHLHRALNAGRIDLDRFLRTTRVLAEEQFMKRALIEKIQHGLPLGSAALSAGWS